ncbi:glutaredoxin family protein [Thalassobellus suaedae]|uniref:Glutaredoxin family protein n=1 Tax=Thalassobellus suaedae TaxID=3074124 RepID=A0ABY9Y899_9FLAO|nr:glutaredoxin family protein [Flavobacteriaceae bacterium HL-DH10]
MKYLVLVLVFLVSLGSSSQDLNNAIKFDKQDKIIVYGSDTCHYCIDTKAYLKERKIDFTYYDVDVNLEKQREMLIKLQKAGFSVDNLSLPVVDLHGKLIMNGTDFEGFLKKLIINKK